MASLSPDELATLERILAKLGDSGADLPWPLFRFVTEIAATANVDLLVHDQAGRVLLAWRNDPFGRGWHVPGSIIRHREEIAHRITACAAEEFGCPLDVGPLAALLQIFDDRGHSISMIHPATLAGQPARLASGDAAPREGDLRWFEALPDDMYPSHLAYREIVATLRAASWAGSIPLFTQHTGSRDAAQPGTAGAIDASTSLTARNPASAV